MVLSPEAMSWYQCGFTINSLMLVPFCLSVYRSNVKVHVSFSLSLDVVGQFSRQLYLLVLLEKDEFPGQSRNVSSSNIQFGRSPDG